LHKSKVFLKKNPGEAYYAISACPTWKTEKNKNWKTGVNLK
jgi:hypothetical protein